VIAIDQHPKRIVRRLPLRSGGLTARPESGRDYYVAIFNISDSPQNVHYAFSELGLVAGGYRLRDLWEHLNVGAAKAIEVSLPAHACVLYRVSPERGQSIR
jgi:alpha-galactosidase